MLAKISPLPLLVALVFIGQSAAADEPQQEIPLWPNGAPGFESRKDEKPVRNEKSNNEFTVTNVHSPTLTVFLPPKDKATGTAVVIVPGGGHREIWLVHEGTTEAKWLAERGIACFLLKYRLAREQGSPYKLPDTPTQDGQRAMRLVRSRAAEWGVNPNRIGIMGFSAGGELAAYVCNADAKGKDDAEDPIDRLNSRPDFQVLIYPGPGGIRGQSITKEMNMPPTFIAVGDDDRFALFLASHYLALKQAGVSAELHIYAKVGHGFGYRENNRRPGATWLDALVGFLGSEGLLKKE